MSAPAWHLLTGELARGGIGDYTRLLADALADAGREVHVWSPDAAGVDAPPRVGPSHARASDAWRCGSWARRWTAFPRRGGCWCSTRRRRGGCAG